jgi:dimethylargininase
MTTDRLNPPPPATEPPGRARAWVALTRPVPTSINDCEISFIGREPIDLARAHSQHAAYASALEAAGCVVERLAAENSLPDSVFIEDAAVVFGELAVVTHPGAVSRRAEVTGVAAALAQWRTVHRIEAPATLDGGDVLVVGKVVYVGASARTNLAGIEQFAAILKPHGYTVRAVPVERCLHLKSAVTQVAEGTVLLNPALVDEGHFRDLEIIRVDPQEPEAANALLVGTTLLHGSSYPLTRGRLQATGIAVTAVDVTELAKAEGAVTCCSLIISTSHS